MFEFIAKAVIDFANGALLAKWEENDDSGKKKKILMFSILLILLLVIGGIGALFTSLSDQHQPTANDAHIGSGSKNSIVQADDGSTAIQAEGGSNVTIDNSVVSNDNSVINNYYQTGGSETKDDPAVELSISSKNIKTAIFLSAGAFIVLVVTAIAYFIHQNWETIVKVVVAVVAIVVICVVMPYLEISDGVKNTKSESTDIHYLFDSHKEEISFERLDGVNGFGPYSRKQVINLIFNEIYARYGCTFGDNYVQDYFDGRTWYPNIKGNDGNAASFDETQFDSDIELYNVIAISAYQYESGDRKSLPNWSQTIMARSSVLDIISKHPEIDIARFAPDLSTDLTSKYPDLFR